MFRESVKLSCSILACHGGLARWEDTESPAVDLATSAEGYQQYKLGKHYVKP